MTERLVSTALSGIYFRFSVRTAIKFLDLHCKGAMGNHCVPKKTDQSFEGLSGQIASLNEVGIQREGKKI